MIGPEAAKHKQNLALAAVLTGLAAYGVLFYATRLPSVEEKIAGDGPADVVFRRIDLLGQIALLPDELLLGAWFGSPPQISLLDRLPVLLLSGAILGVAAVAGWLLLVLFRADRCLDRLETAVFSTAVGLNLLSTYVLLVGLVGLLGSRAALGVPAALVMAGAAGCWWRRYVTRSTADSRRRLEEAQETSAPTSILAAGGSRRSAPRQVPSLKLSPRWLWLAAPFAAVILLGAMLPPVEFDVREYHLQVPKEWFQAGRIDFLPHNVYGNMPLGAEMLSLLAMAVSGDWWLGALAGKTVIASFTLLAALGLVTAGRRFFSPAAGIIAALIYVSTPWIVQVSTNGLVEGASACYLLLAVYAVLMWRQKEERAAAVSPHLILAGYLVGAAVATKYPAVLFVVLPLLVWIVVVEVWRNWRGAWKTAGVFLLAVVAGCGLWFGKNAVLAGNPTYPLLYDVFGGRTWTPEKNARWNRVHLPHDFSPKAMAASADDFAWRSEWLSPLLVPLGVLALANRSYRRRAAALWVLLGYVIAAWWLLTHRIDRFWIPAISLLALLAGWGACWRADGLWRKTVLTILIVVLVANFLVCAAGPGGDNRYFVSLDLLRHHPERVDGWVDPWHRYFNGHAGAGRVLLVGDAQPFDLEVPVLYSTCFDDCLFEQLVKGRTAEEIRAALAERDITHVYVDWDEIGRYRKPGNYGFTDFVQPEVFARLVEQGVLEPLPVIEGHRGRGYCVAEMSAP